MTNLKNFINKLRSMMPVVYTLITPMHRDFTFSWSYFSMMRRFHVDDINKLPSFMAVGSREREIPEVVQPKNTDIVLEKSMASIFMGTNFEHMMRNHNVLLLYLPVLLLRWALNRAHGTPPTGVFIRWWYLIVFLP